MRLPRCARWIIAAGFLAAGCGETPGHSPSVLLVTLDTVRADHLGVYGSTRGASPQLDALATRAVVFERAFAVAPMTLPAHASLLTGRLPTRTGLRWNGEQKLTVTLPTLAERFGANGYATAAFVSALVLDHAFGLDRGFESYDDEIGRPAGEGVAWKAERPAQETVRRALFWLNAQPVDRPVFLWVHLFEPHDPYLPPEPFAGHFQGDPYSGEIAAADDALGTLLASARFRPEARAILSVIGDHGESLGEHGEATHGVLLYDGTLRVPWLLAAPSLHPQRVGSAVSQVDLAPTLLALAGLPPLAAPQELDGIDLADGLRGNGSDRARTLYAESLYANFLYGWAPLRSTRRGAFKWIAGSRNELFDTAHDAGETRDLTGTATAEASVLARALAEFRSRETATPGASPAAVDESLAAGLRSLGYLSGGGPRSEEAAAEDPRDRIVLHERLRAIDEQWKRGDVSGAEEALDQVFAADPDNRLVRRVIAQQVRSAIAALAGGPRPDTDAVLRLRIRLAQLLAQEGRRDEARTLLELAADSAAQGAAALNVRAFARLELGRKEEARRDWQAILRIAPDDASVRLNLATLALGERRFDEAERWASAAVALAPRSPGALNALGIALEQLGKTVEAEARYRAALAADPAFFRAELNLGLLLATSGKANAAIAALDRVLTRSPREPLAHLALGRMQALRPREREAARRHLTAFLEIAPDHPRAAEVRTLLAQLSLGAGGGG